MADPKANIKDATAHLQTLYTASQALTEATKGLAKAFGTASGEEVKLINVSRSLADSSKNVASFGQVFEGVMTRMAKPVDINIDDIQVALSELEESQIDMLKAYEKSSDQMKNWYETSYMLADKAMIRHRAELEALRDKQKGWSMLIKLRKSILELGTVTHDRLMSVPALYALAEVSKKVWQTSVQYTEVLQQANSSILDRFKLMKSGLAVQIATGQSLKNVAETMKEMVDLGLETSATFQADLQTAVMLNKALGVSNANAASLARAADMTGSNFREVADAVATVAEMTSLSADEAARMSAELGKAMRVWMPAQQLGGFAGAAKELMLFAGALKTVGGVADDIAKLTTDIVSARNLGAAAILGVDRATLSSQKGIRQMKESLAGLSEQLQGNPFLIQAYAKVLGVSAETLATATSALKKENELRVKYGHLLEANEALQTRYNRQMGDTGEAVDMLKNTFNALLGEALLPLSTGLMLLARGITSVIQGINDFFGTTKVLSTVIGVGLVGTFVLIGIAVKSAIRVLRDFWHEVKIMTVELINSIRSLRGSGVMTQPTFGKVKGGGMAGKAAAAGTVATVIGSLAGGGIGDFISSLGSAVWSLSAIKPVVIPLIKALVAAATGAAALNTALLAATAGLIYMAWYSATEDKRIAERNKAVQKDLDFQYRGMIKNANLTGNGLDNLSRTINKLNKTEEGRVIVAAALLEAQDEAVSAVNLAEDILAHIPGGLTQEGEKALLAPVAEKVATVVIKDKNKAEEILKGNATLEELRVIALEHKAQAKKIAEDEAITRRKRDARIYQVKIGNYAAETAGTGKFRTAW